MSGRLGHAFSNPLFNPFNTFFDKKLEFQNQSHRFARFSNSMRSLGVGLSLLILFFGLGWSVTDIFRSDESHTGSLSLWLLWKKCKSINTCETDNEKPVKDFVFSFFSAEMVRRKLCLWGSHTRLYTDKVVQAGWPSHKTVSFWD